MAVTWPRTAAQFADLLKIASVKAKPGKGEEMAGYADGEWLTAKLRPDLWEFEVATAWLAHDALAEVQFEVEALDGDNTALLYVPSRMYPIADPTGALYAAASPTVASVNASRLQLALQNCLSGQIVTKGDLLQIDYDSASRIALVRAGETVTADGSGDTVEFQVTPSLRPAVTAVDAVTVIKPCAKVKIDQKSVAEESNRDGFSRLTFNARQTLQAD